MAWRRLPSIRAVMALAKTAQRCRCSGLGRLTLPNALGESLAMRIRLKRLRVKHPALKRGKFA
jgi:hypothetical protein